MRLIYCFFIHTTGEHGHSGAGPVYFYKTQEFRHN